MLQTLPWLPSSLRVKAKSPNNPPGLRWSGLCLSLMLSLTLSLLLLALATQVSLLLLSTLLASRLCPGYPCLRSPLGACHLLSEASPTTFLNSTACPHPTLQSHSPYSCFSHYNLLTHHLAYPFIVIYCLTLSSRMKSPYKQGPLSGFVTDISQGPRTVPGTQ